MSRAMHKGLPVINEKDVTVEGMVPVDPLNAPPSIQAVTAKYNGIIGDVAGQLAQLQAIHEAFVANARQVVETQQTRIRELEDKLGVNEAEKIVSNGTTA